MKNVNRRLSMKRVIALLLTVIMLAALFPASIAAQAETVTKEGFYLVNWGREIENGTYDHVYAMPYTWIDTSRFSADSQSINIDVYFNNYNTGDIKEAAAKLYDDFEQRPAGARYINLAALASVFKHCVKDAIDMEDGVRLVADWLDRFLAEYKSIGGQLDGIAVDLEYSLYTSFYLQSHFCSKYTEGGVTKDPRDLDILQDIVRNKRVYQEKIRPQLAEYEKQGLFQFYTKKINPQTGLPDDLSTAVGPTYNARVPIPVSEITTINRYDDNGGDAASRSTWDLVLQNYLADCITRAAYDPMVKYYPDGILSDYRTGDAYSWHKSMSTSGAATGTAVKAGNASNGVYYGVQFSEYYWATYSKSTTRKLYEKPAGYNKAVFDPTDAYTRVLYDVNNQKRVLASTIDKMGAEDAKVNVWVPYFHYADTEKSYGNSAYFSELMYHLGLTNPEPFLGYIIKSEVESKGKYYDDKRMGSYDYALQISNQILAELTRVAGTSDRKPIVTPMSWNEGYILSGMYAGGRNIWRLTPDTGKVSVEDFKVEDTAPTFRVGDMTITFPNGRIIKDTKITQIGSCGYWIETPANVTPVVTTTADRYANDPSFREDFSNYRTGTFVASAYSMLKTTSGRPDTYWEATGKAEIKANGGDQYLSLSGNAKLTNSKIVEKITAGDYYAQQQAWEVKVTLPEGNYGTVTLLDAGENDGGIQISDGKVYYDQNGDYQEMEGLSLSAGTYIFQREVDFRTIGEYRCSYAVYDTSGDCLGDVDDVPMAIAAIPVTTLEITTTGASSAVQIDDYKLFPTGVTTNLELYQIDRGRKIADTAAARSQTTAYRFTWMNASDRYQVARVYDAKSGTILKKVEMAPGMDGVVTGIVEASASKQIVFAVDIKDGTTPDYDSGNTTPNNPGSGDSGNTTPNNPGSGDSGNITPGNPGSGEEGGNIYDDGIVEGTPETTPGAGNPAGDASNVGGADGPADVTAETKGVNGKIILLIVVLSIAVLAGAGVAVYIFIVKPKLAAKPTDESPEISEE